MTQDPADDLGFLSQANAFGPHQQMSWCKVRLLHAAVWPTVERLKLWLSECSLDVTIAQWLVAQGLAPYVFYRLRTEGLVSQIAPEPRAILQTNFYATTVQHLLLAEEARALIFELQSYGLEPVILKGMALATTLYPTSSVRPVSDLDLLIERSEAQVIQQVLRKRGFQDLGLEPKQHVAFGNHLHMSKDQRNAPLVIEVHWQLTHDPGYARCINLSDLYARTQMISFGAYSARVLDSADQLFHACIHLMLHHAEDWRLIWLLDIHLLIRKFGPTWDWTELMRRAEEFQLAGIVRYWLSLAEAWFGPCLTEAARQELAETRITLRETQLITAVQTGHSSALRREWLRALSHGSIKPTLTYITGLFFPPWAYMQNRYGFRTRALAPIYYIWRIVHGIWTVSRLRKAVGPVN